ncbi:unnamed protein product [Zymoseptoria tritici ST99CH_1E4]|uniref:RRM domain-containing protein n=1 Tax=Zymoseptoria tritici ST99CH_1E4 TaxID=1276532 RepID=A0A2H1G5S5_ZYMTR|nr:unnamed protein product [Zymoseptoria tritici ST99CH_1E4]
MAANKPAPSFDQLLQQSRKKRQAEILAQEIFGKARSRTPTGPRAKPAQPASLASRVGVAKQRPASLTRTQSAPAPRNARQPRATRPVQAADTSRLSNVTYAQPSSDLISEPKSNGFGAVQEQGAAGFNVRGAAGGPHVVIAENFAPGTTAADIESVMLDVGGQMSDCKLVAAQPTVIAEMTFIERTGAETVIGTFNGKKADGRTLHVYWKSSGTGTFRGAKQQQPLDLPAPTEEDPIVVDDVMELDEHAQAREAEDRQREERRRGYNDSAGSFPAGPKADRGGYGDNYYNNQRRPQQSYSDGRQSYNGGGRGGRDRYDDGGRGRYRDNGNRGQSWRP